MTAAHRTLPFGTPVRVTNLDNGRSVLLVINDRGPFVRGRVIDVSTHAAEMLAFRNRGVARVRVDTVKK
jgi:rare lipoprotein A